jgi:t-SNARE complex subunit (syntaxin)
MSKAEPLTDDDGEVRELTMEDIKRFRPIGNVAAIYRAFLDQPRAGNDEVAKLADPDAGKQVSLHVVGNRRGELRWILRELDRRGWLTAQATQQVKTFVEN